MPRSFLAIKDTYRRFRTQRNQDETDAAMDMEQNLTKSKCTITKAKSEPKRLTSQRHHPIWTTPELHKHHDEMFQRATSTESFAGQRACIHLESWEREKWYPRKLDHIVMGTDIYNCLNLPIRDCCRRMERIRGKCRRQNGTFASAVLRRECLIKEFGHLGSKQFWMQFMDRSKWPSQKESETKRHDEAQRRTGSQRHVEVIHSLHQGNDERFYHVRNYHNEANQVWQPEIWGTFSPQSNYSIIGCKGVMKKDDDLLKGSSSKEDASKVRDIPDRRRKRNQLENVFSDKAWTTEQFGKREKETGCGTGIAGKFKTNQNSTKTAHMKVRGRCQVDSHKEDGGDRPFICHVCNKSFKRRSSLATHKFIHTDLKPHNCTECNKKFLRKSDLKKHGLMHSGKKPYKCEKCGRQFSQSSNMLTHMRRHMGIRPFNCTRCGRSFFRKVDLRRHEGRHLAKKTKQRH